MLKAALELARTVDTQFVISVCSMQLSAHASAESPTEAIPLLRESLDHLADRDMNLFRFGSAAAIKPFYELVGGHFGLQLAYLLGAVDELPGPKDPTIEAANDEVRAALTAQLAATYDEKVNEGRQATSQQMVTTTMAILEAAEAAIKPVTPPPHDAR